VIILPFGECLGSNMGSKIKQKKLIYCITTD